MTPETIIIDDQFNKNWTVAQSLLWAAMCSLNQDIVRKFKTDETFPLTLNVVLTINEVQVPFVKIIERWHKEFEAYTNEETRKEAVKIVGSKYDDLLKMLDQMKEQVQNHLKFWD